MSVCVCALSIGNCTHICAALPGPEQPATYVGHCIVHVKLLSVLRESLERANQQHFAVGIVVHTRPTRDQHRTHALRACACVINGQRVVTQLLVDQQNDYISCLCLFVCSTQTRARMCAVHLITYKIVLEYEPRTYRIGGRAAVWSTLGVLY